MSPGSIVDPLLRDDRAGVHALVQEVDGDAGLLRAGRERLADRVEAGEGRQERRMHVDAREAREEAGREELHVPGADDELDIVRGEPLGHRVVAVLAAGVVLQRERGGRHPAARRVRAPALPPCSRRPRRPAARRRGAPAGSCPCPRRGRRSREPADDEPCARVGLRDDGAHADAEVEDPALLLLGDALLVEPGVDGRPLPRAPVDLGAEPGGSTRGRLPMMPPPVMWASARTSAWARRPRTSSR